MQTYDTFTPPTHDFEYGLKSLTLCHHENRDDGGEKKQQHRNSCIMTSNYLSPPLSPSLSDIGDCIGMESCYDMERKDDFCMKVSEEEVAIADDDRSQSYRCKNHRRSSAAAASKKEFPPPIPLLARTENLQSHMPWILRRYYTSDGRLILREERVKHHEYFRAHRSNGRLILQLVPLDDDVLMPPFAENEEEQCSPETEKEEHEQEMIMSDDESEKGDDEEETDDNANESDDHETVVEMKDGVHSNVDSSVGNGGSNNGGGGGAAAAAKTWLNYSTSVSISSSSCFLGLPVPAVKPVHT